MNDTQPRRSTQLFRIRFGLVILLSGFLLFIIGVRPSFFGADRSSVTGFVQITVFLVGLSVMCIGGYVALNALWNGRQKSILADIGIRLVATGLVIALASGMADIFGIGSQSFPKIPSFGGVQVIGVWLAEATIALGFLLFIPYVWRGASSTDLVDQ